MKPLNIPVVAVGPGSQPPEDIGLNYLEMPKGMHTFVMPEVPDTGDKLHAAQAKNVIQNLADALRAYWRGEAGYPRLELAHLAPETRDMLNQVLREGEVSALVQHPGQTRIQETIFAGVWRVQHLDSAGGLEHDYLEACPIPEVIRAAAAAGAKQTVDPVPPPAGVMNSPALLFEIQEQAKRYRPGNPAHVVNLTLLPLSPADNEYLGQVLPSGPVNILSRGYGKCRIASTGLKHVWRVQYYNNMDTLILNTVEVTGVPEVALAAKEDLEDSLARLDELLEWMDTA